MRKIVALLLKAGALIDEVPVWDRNRVQQIADEIGLDGLDLAAQPIVL